MSYYREGDPFNPYLYNPKHPNFVNQFLIDWAACLVEHGRGNPTRVVPFAQYVDLTTGKVYSADPKYGFAEVNNAPGDPLYTGTRNLFSILTQPRNYLSGIIHIIHFSPPDPKIGFKEGRITIYTATKTSAEKVHVQAYGSIGCGIPWKDYQNFAHRLLPGVNFTNPQQLRDFPFIVDPQGQNFITWLWQKIPELSEDWQAIFSGLAHEHLAQVLSKIEQKIPEAKIRQIIATGHLGLALDSNTTDKEVNFTSTQCPTTRARASEPGHSHPDGKHYKFVINCGKCGFRLNKWMTKGDRCPFCWGVYLGC